MRWSADFGQWMLRLGRSLYQAWLDLFGEGDAGERILLADGREVRRLGDLHRREIRNVFGLFELNRVVYGSREGQKIEAVLLDERLQLPQGKNSEPDRGQVLFRAPCRARVGWMSSNRRFLYMPRGTAPASQAAVCRNVAAA